MTYLPPNFGTNMPKQLDEMDILLLRACKNNKPISYFRRILSRFFEMKAPTIHTLLVVEHLIRLHKEYGRPEDNDKLIFDASPDNIWKFKTSKDVAKEYLRYYGPFFLVLRHYLSGTKIVDLPGYVSPLRVRIDRLRYPQDYQIP